MSLQQCVTISMGGMWTTLASFVPGAAWVLVRYRSCCNNNKLETVFTGGFRRSSDVPAEGSIPLGWNY